MASVVFSSVGLALGGPLGAAVGAAVGSTVDGVLFGRRGGSGDLQVQRSSYGDVIPRLFGRTRVAGVVIWALPTRGRGGKGSRRSRSSTSFAVALSSGPIRSVGRIWADGREFRNESGEFEVAATMRVYRGGGRQTADPLVLAAEGAEGAAAYRGLSYVVLEDLDLEPFGNRIPNLSFEVEADVGTAASWLHDLADVAGIEADGRSAGEAPTGYAQAAARLVEDVSVLARVSEAEPSYRDGGLSLLATPRLFFIPMDALAVPPGRSGFAVQRGAATARRPASLSLEYLDAARDYQAGSQQILHNRSGPALAVSLPLAASASAAQALTRRWLRRAEAAVDTLELSLGWAWLDLSVGDHFRLGDGPEHWRVTQRVVEALLVRVSAELVAGPEAATAIVADGGRSLPAPLVPAGPTRLACFEVPVPLKPGPPAIWISANGGPGWRGARVSVLTSGGEVDLGEVASGTACGVLAAALEPGPEGIWDEVNQLQLSVEIGGPVFESRPASAVLGGANLLRVGGELLQYRVAEADGEGRVVLRGLLRRRFGSGGSSQLHAAGAVAELVRPEALLAWPLAVDQVGAGVVVLGNGAQDPPGGSEAAHVVIGLGVGPMAPAHLWAERRPDGEIRSRWVPRGREAFEWSGGEPAPARFAWQMRAADGAIYEVLVDETSLVMSAAMQVAQFGMLLPAGSLTVTALGEGPAWARTSATMMI